MICPLCDKIQKKSELELTDSRHSRDRKARFRKYRCPICGSRFLVTEEIKNAEVLVVGKKHASRLFL